MSLSTNVKTHGSKNLEAKGVLGYVRIPRTHDCKNVVCEAWWSGFKKTKLSCPRTPYPKKALPERQGCVVEHLAGNESNSKRKYFQFRYRDSDGKVRTKHIPGGNVTKKKAQENARRVREAIAHGLTISEILELINFFNQKKQWKK